MNEHSKRFDRVKKYYDAELWHIEQLEQAVKKDWITQEELEEITGESY